MKGADGQHNANHCEGHHQQALNEERLDPDTLEEQAPRDDHEVARRHEQRHALQDERHVLDGVQEARQQEGGRKVTTIATWVANNCERVTAER